MTEQQKNKHDGVVPLSERSEEEQNNEELYAVLGMLKNIPQARAENERKKTDFTLQLSSAKTELDFQIKENELVERVKGDFKKLESDPEWIALNLKKASFFKTRAQEHKLKISQELMKRIKECETKIKEYNEKEQQLVAREKALRAAGATCDREIPDVFNMNVQGLQ